jgi:hypothetical protein
MDFVLRAVHCVRETSGGGSDEIVLGAVLVGASGNTKVVPAQVIGDFDDDGDGAAYVSTGDLPLGQFSLRTTNGYPKTMYCILQLVESDQDDADAAQGLTDALSVIVTIAVSALATPAAGAAAGAVVTAVGALIALFISDDPPEQRKRVRKRWDERAASHRRHPWPRRGLSHRLQGGDECLSGRCRIQRRPVGLDLPGRGGSRARELGSLLLTTPALDLDVPARKRPQSLCDRRRVLFLPASFLAPCVECTSSKPFVSHVR